MTSTRVPVVKATALKYQLPILTIKGKLTFFFTGLQDDLNDYIFGQHIAAEVISIALDSHVNKKHRQKPLVLNFHGWTGGGKGYVAKFIVKNFFKEGFSSKFVKQYVGEKDFPSKHEYLLYQV